MGNLGVWACLRTNEKSSCVKGTRIVYWKMPVGSEEIWKSSHIRERLEREAKRADVGKVQSFK